MTRIILVRHGETEWNAAARVQGHMDVPMNDTGRRQVETAADALKHEPVTAVYASDLLRAAETGEILARPHGLSVNVTPLLRERHWGVWQGRTMTEIEESDAAMVGRLRAGEWVTPEMAEAFEDLQNRVVEAIEGIAAAHADQTVLIASHGGPIKTFVAWVLGAPLEARGAMRTSNAAYSVVLRRTYRYVLESYNVTAHLAAHQQTPRPPSDTTDGRRAIETAF